jgi:hypothetical protein
MPKLWRNNYRRRVSVAAALPQRDVRGHAVVGAGLCADLLPSHPRVDLENARAGKRSVFRLSPLIAKGNIIISLLDRQSIETERTVNG